MIKLGITGGIGAGKSVVSHFFQSIGIPVYFADDESKRLTADSIRIRRELTNRFGSEIFTDGVLNKSLLASLIFENPENLRLVNSIIHPEVGRDFDAWMEKKNNHFLVAMEAAILFESGFDTKMDLILTVVAPVEERIERVLKRENTTREQILSRISNQWTDEEKMKKSDFIIYNDDDSAIIPQIEAILNELNMNQPRKKK